MRETRLLVLAWVGIVALGLAPGAARAQGEGDSLTIARDHMEQGQAYYLQGRFDEAAAEFEMAFQAQPFSAFLFNEGVAYENAGHLSRAIEAFDRYLGLEPDASDRATVQARVEALRERVAARAAAAASAAQTVDSHETPTAEATPDIPAADATPAPTELPEDFKSIVNVRTTPEGAVVRITSASGEAVTSGTSPLSSTLTAGRYHVVIEHPSFNRAETDVEVEPGKVYLIVMNLSQGEFLGYLHVVSDPPGAQVFVDDHGEGARGAAPWEGPARVGAHHLWIERAGYETVEQDVDVTVGSDTNVRVTLERARVGRLRIIGNVRGATISVDGHQVGAIPWEGELASGTHRVRVEAENMKAWERAVEIARGQLTPVRVRLSPAPGRGGAYVTGVFTGLALAGGITMSVLANEWDQQLRTERAHGTLASDDPRIDQGFGFSIAQWGGYGLAAILLGVTIYYAVYDDLPPSEASVLEPRDWAILPMVDPQTGMAGLAAGGRF